MSGWHANTKSVKSYGKNRTRVVKVLVDLSDTPVKDRSSLSPVYHHATNSPAKVLFVRASNSTSSLNGRKDVLQDKNGRGDVAVKGVLGAKKGEVDGCAKGGKEGGKGKGGKKVFTVRTDDENDEVDELDTDQGEDQENVGIPSRAALSSRTSKSSKSSIGSTSSADSAVVLAPRRRKQVIPSSPPSSVSSPVVISTKVSTRARQSASPAPSTSTTRSTRSRSARAISDSPPPPRRTATATSTRSKRAVIPATPPSSYPSPRTLSSPAHSDEEEEEDDDDETTLKPILNPPSTSSSTSSPLSSLLLACNQPTPPSPFAPFLSNPLFFSSSANRTITKVGEATYSEVFSLSSGEGKNGERDLVMKVVPLMSDEKALEVAMKSLSLASKVGGEVEGEVGEVDGEEVDELDEEVEPTWSDPRDVAKEVRLGRLVGELDGFCDLIGAFVVQGAYPDQLLEQWDAFAAANPERTENARPSVFPSNQLYAVLLLPYGGVDLESYSFSKSHGWAEAAGIFWSVSQAMAVAEEEVRFEHRDLHLGQILVQPSSSGEAFSSSGSFDASSGLETTIIDFGLSRVDAPASEASEEEGKTWWTPLDEEIFEGKGRQWDVYRSMRNHIGEDWTGYHPLTNLMWLHYILSTLLKSKSLPPSPVTSSRSRKTKAKPDARETEAWKCLDGTRKELEKVLKGKAGEEWVGAGTLVKWGRERGWCA